MPTQKKDRNGNLIWYGRIPQSGRDRVKACKTKREALDWEAEQRRLIEEQKIDHSSSMIHTDSLLSLATRYLQDCQQHVTKGNLNAKKLAFKRLFKSFEPTLQVCMLTKAMLRSHINKIGREVSNNSANVDLRHLLACYNWGIKLDLLPSPCPWNIDKLRVQETEIYIPSFEDLKKVLAQTKTLQDKIMLQMYFETAARRAELYKLKWTDVDIERQSIRLWTKKRVGGMEADLVSISGQLASKLSEHKLKTGLFGFVFVNPKTDRPYGDRRAWLNGLIKRAGVKRFTNHQIRHLTASTLVDEGETLATAQALLRHKNATTTARYLHRLRGVALPNAIARKAPSLNPEIEPEFEVRKNVSQ